MPSMAHDGVSLGYFAPTLTMHHVFVNFLKNDCPFIVYGTVFVANNDWLKKGIERFRDTVKKCSGICTPNLLKKIKLYPICITVPLMSSKVEETYTTSTGVDMVPKWYARFLWHGPVPEAKVTRSQERNAEVADVEMHSMAGNPLNLEIESLSNVPGKYVRRKRWRSRNGLAFIKFMYEGQVGIARVTGRDFFIQVTFQVSS
jgi:hypothetical protein